MTACLNVICFASEISFSIYWTFKLLPLNKRMVLTEMIYQSWNITLKFQFVKVFVNKLWWCLRKWQQEVCLSQPQFMQVCLRRVTPIFFSTMGVKRLGKQLWKHVHVMNFKLFEIPIQASCLPNNGWEKICKRISCFIASWMLQFICSHSLTADS